MQNTNSRPGGPYDEYYASIYNDVWGKSDKWKAEANFHIETIEKFIKPGTKWLDAGCGTGYFLSHFPDVYRGGFDLSTAMLSEARKANPSAQFLEEMNLIDIRRDWEHKWNLVTCTGQPWSYFKTLEEIEKTVENLSKWTTKDGHCILTPIDISDFLGEQVPNYFNEALIPSGSPIITGIHWTYNDLNIVDNCLSPNLDQWVRWFSKWFKKIEIMRWPHEPSFLIIPRRVIVCSGKRDIGDQSETVVIEHQIPNSGDNIEWEDEEPTPITASLSNKQLLSEVAARVRSGNLFRAILRKVF